MHNKNIRELKWWENTFKYPMLYAVEKKRATLIPLLIFFLLYLLFASCSTNSQPGIVSSLSKNWFDLGGHVDIVLQLMTLFVVVSVWIAQLHHDWKASLDKLLSATFSYNGEIYDHLTTEYVPLISEADVRPLGQSLGQLKNANKHLPLDSRNNKLTKIIHVDTSPGEKISNQPFWHYHIEMPLREPLKEENQQLVNFLKKIDGQMNKLDKKFKEANTKQLSWIMHQVDQVIDNAGKKEGERVDDAD